MATISMFFPENQLPNFVQFKQY